MKKKKLNSKNPKYMDKSHITEAKTKKKLIKEVKGCKIYAVNYL
jgi:heptaprenylglyceryl phosphate synthase